MVSVRTERFFLLFFSCESAGDRERLHGRMCWTTPGTYRTALVPDPSLPLLFFFALTFTAAGWAQCPLGPCSTGGNRGSVVPPPPSSFFFFSHAGFRNLKNGRWRLCSVHRHWVQVTRSHASFSFLSSFLCWRFSATAKKVLWTDPQAATLGAGTAGNHLSLFLFLFFFFCPERQQRT